MGSIVSCGCYTHLDRKNHTKSNKKFYGETQNKFFIFGIDSTSRSFINYFDSKKLKLIKVNNQQTLWNFSGNVMLDQNRIFMCGGVNFSMDAISNQCAIYSIRDNDFEALEAMQHIRFNFPCILHQNKVFAIGGRSYGYDEIAILASCEFFDLSTKKWNTMPDMRIPRCGHQLFIFEDKLYAVGGLSTSKHVKRLECFDFGSFEWRLTDIKLTFDYFNFEIYAKDPDEFLLLGGFHRYGVSNFIHSVNLRDKTVKCQGFMKAQRAHFKLFFEPVTNSLILFGGVAQNDPLFQTRYAESYDLVTRQSTPLYIHRKSKLPHIQNYNFAKFSCKIQSSTELTRDDGESGLQE